MTSFRVLGSIEVVVNDQPVAIGGRTQIRLLAFLLLSANRAISTDAISDAVWGSVRAGADSRLQMAIVRMRRVLEPARSAEPPRLRTVSGGYMLAVAPGELDADVFEALVGDGCSALEGGEPVRAKTLLEDALGLWRGPPLAEVAFEDFAQAEIRRLEEQRLVASECRIEADLELGHHAHVVGELEALLAREPARERVAGQLMLALYRCGRQRDALEVFQRTRGHLIEELGLEPGPALQGLQAQILAHAAELDGTAPDRISAHATRADGTAASGAAPSAEIRPRLAWADVPRGAYVGRDEQHARISRCWEAAVSGERQGVLVCGDPGIGKTQFLRHAARDLHLRGALVLSGRCLEDVAPPYGGWIHALSPLVEQGSRTMLEAYVEQYGGELSRLVPAIARRVPDAPPPRAVDPETERYLLFSAVVGLLEHAAATAPVLLLFDDLHWADRTTLTLLKHVVAETPHLRLLILASYRESELARDHALTGALADLYGEERITRLELGPLARDEVGTLVAAAAGLTGRAVPHEWTSSIANEAGGNPFFVVELVRHLVDSGIPRPGAESVPDQRAVERLDLPQSVRDVVLRRVDRLGDDCRLALSYASVIGSEFELELLARASGEDEDSLVDVLDAAIAARLIDEHDGASGSYRFAHDLIHHALYGSLGATRRARAHRRIAEALEGLCGSAPEPQLEALARHWTAASLSDIGKACYTHGGPANRRLRLWHPTKPLGGSRDPSRCWAPTPRAAPRSNAIS